ncbi:hypothetical protein Y032_0069g329 [Ancylostoma ceylanicum]|uniref:Acyltransferase 3 domain-containing protein n=1 Tax=Ancylostoma ceylanicum TaxID=53326 RepID=A0A016TYH1_9BILA|nr:hypothetical protein Y032_0069g329 [Ancylostoma ceylanicum]
MADNLHTCLHNGMFPKRDVVQGLRGWSTIFVLLFYTYCNIFPNGYVGADAIMVISGFIAAYILRKERVIDKTVIKEFYCRRGKRLLAFYYLAVFLTMVACYLFLPISYQQMNLERSKTALLLISNIKLTCFENRFSIMLPSVEDAFGHYWLPCILIQWYLVAPILFWMQRLITEKDKLFFTVVSVVSMGAYLFSRNMVSAYWLHARLWQFCAGVIAVFYLPKDNGMEQSPEQESLLGPQEKFSILDSGDRVRGDRSESSTTWPNYARSCFRHPVFFLPLLIPVMWFRFPTFDLRLYITAATALLLYAGQKDESIPFLVNRVTVFLGNISYALYLVHWPVHCIATYYNDVVSRSLEIGLCITFVIALLAHYQFIKVFRAMSTSVTAGFYTIIIVITIILSMKEVNYENEKLHYATITPYDAFYDIVNSIF